ncbi:MUTL protein homolog 3 [Actinidia rufa]|uniref:MUTL protein homolog 3 n=1 Tax=Actinidia rufa TaxID=165716 RepID=A0A7J0EML1_9ERIC|nr:MUTL protein homolog 3 [Actinidia rufa]
MPYGGCTVNVGDVVEIEFQGDESDGRGENHGLGENQGQGENHGRCGYHPRKSEINELILSDKVSTTCLLQQVILTTCLFQQCAHGRPTTVPLVNLEALHKQIAKLGSWNGSPNGLWHGATST